ncbi:MAG: hypothetical protein JWN14_1958 [Chthonomonadales bacterium]|nr:hypothetical protein [Chthonomonadales bacterium]
MMRKRNFALLGLLLIGSVCSFVGCAPSNGTDVDAKKASDSQKATGGAPSLGNPKPAGEGGK